MLLLAYELVAFMIRFLKRYNTTIEELTQVSVLNYD